MQKDTFQKKAKKQHNQKNWFQNDEDSFTRRSMLKQTQYKRKPKYKNADDWNE